MGYVVEGNFGPKLNDDKSNDKIVKLFEFEGMKILQQGDKQYVQIGDVYMDTDEIPEEFEKEVEAMIKAYRDHLDGKIKKLAR